MARASRESVYAALFALGSSLTWVNCFGQSVQPAESSRRVQQWDSINKPAFLQVEHRESLSQVTNLPTKLTLKAEWWFYISDGEDANAVPTTTVNNLVDAVEKAIGIIPNIPQTLGGLVHHCWIDGEVLRVAGDIGGQGVVIVPVALLCP
jgi:hypothetical protein